VPALRGVRLSEGPSRGWAAPGGAVLGVMLAACAGDRIVVGGQLPPVVSEVVDADAGAGRDGGTTPSGIGTRAQCPVSPGERRELLGCWPTRQVGGWRGFWLGLPRYETADGVGAEFPPGDVVMRLGVDGSGTFSVGERPSQAPGPCGAGLDAGACAPFGEMLQGFVYRLEQIRLRDAGERGTPRVAGEALPRAGELMEFEIRLGQPWDASCADEAASCAGGACPAARTGETAAIGDGPGGPRVSCACSSDRCIAEAPALALALTMSEDGQALRGAYRPRDLRLPPASLELFKVEGP
jgi:hypothetical protein